MVKGWVEFEEENIDDMEWNDIVLDNMEYDRIEEEKKLKEIEEEKELGFRMIECLNKFEVIDVLVDY